MCFMVQIIFFQDLTGFPCWLEREFFCNKLFWLHFEWQKIYTCTSWVFIECVISIQACLLHSEFHQDYIDMYKWHVKYSEQQQKQPCISFGNQEGRNITSSQAPGCLKLPDALFHSASSLWEVPTKLILCIASLEEGCFNTSEYKVLMSRAAVGCFYNIVSVRLTASSQLFKTLIYVEFLVHLSFLKCQYHDQMTSLWLHEVETWSLLNVSVLDVRSFVNDKFCPCSDLSYQKQMLIS